MSGIEWDRDRRVKQVLEGIQRDREEREKY